MNKINAKKKHFELVFMAELVDFLNVTEIIYWTHNKKYKCQIFFYWN